MKKNFRRSRKRLSDSEVLEVFVQRYNKRRVVDLYKERRRFWKGMIIETFFVGPLLTLFPLMAWFGLVPLYCILVPIIINGVILLILTILFSLLCRTFEASLLREIQIQRTHFTRAWDFLALGWTSLFASLMLLLATVGVLVRLPGRVWVYPLVVYLLIALGLWLGRREIPRASVEGPRDHPWVWVVRVFLSLSLGTCVLLTALVRIFLQVLDRQNVTLALQFLAVFTFSLVPLFRGFAAWAWILAYLHYQKWRGVEELRL